MNIEHAFVKEIKKIVQTLREIEHAFVEKMTKTD